MMDVLMSSDIFDRVIGIQYIMSDAGFSIFDACREVEERKALVVSIDSRFILVVREINEVGGA